MTSFSPTVLLAQRAHSLQIAAPKEWERFVECFDAYATDVTVAVTTAEQHAVLNAQGRAQAFIHLLMTFRTCANPPSATKPQP